MNFKAAKDFYKKNKYRIRPVVFLTKSCIRDITSMRDNPNIMDYINVGFNWKENYDEIMAPSNPSAYFANNSWQPAFNGAFHEFIIDLVNHTHPEKIRSVRVVGSAAAYVAEINGFKFGWAIAGERLEYFCIQRDGQDQAFKILEELFWSHQTNHKIIVGVDKEKLTITEDLSHTGFIKFKKCDELADYIKAYFDKGVSRSILFYGPPGCHRAGQKILMFDGSTKNVEDISPNDLLFGPDSLPRTVLELRRGKGEMVEITPTKGQKFVINTDHILTFQHVRGKMIDVSFKDWSKWTNNKKHEHKLIRTGVDFTPKKKLPLDPYFLGIMLGDGSFSQKNPRITTVDKEIVKFCKTQAKLFNLRLVKYPKKEQPNCPTYGFSGPMLGGKIANPLTQLLKSMGVWEVICENKFVPFEYKTASRQDRLNILAGLLDTDGSLDSNCFDFISKSKQLADDVVFLSRSLGLAAYIKPCTKKDQSGTSGLYYRVSISGHTNEIPTLLKRKKASVRKQIKNVLHVGFTYKILPAQEDFYGFSLDGDQRYLLDDFTITHNSGKSNLVKGITHCLKAKCVRFTDLSSMNNAFVAEILRTLNPDAVVLEDIDHMSMDEIDDLLDKLEDFNNQKKLIFATANQVRKLDDALLRPGRFDEVKEIKTLDEEVLMNLVENDEELFQISKSFPVAFTVELLKRVKVLGKEKALQNMQDIKDRVDNLNNTNYELRSEGNPLDDLFKRKLGRGFEMKDMRNELGGQVPAPIASDPSISIDDVFDDLDK